MKSYRALEQRFRRIAAVNGALAVLGWDQSTMMPEGGAKVRAEQMAVLSVVRHEWITDPAIGGLLGEAEARKDRLNEWQRANLREMQRQWRHATALTPRLVEARSKATLACEMVWRKARANNHFKSFATAFAPVLELTREVAAAKAAAFGLSPYDALLDEYEPEGRAAQIDALFADLGRFLPGFIDRAMARQAKRPAATEIPGPFPADTQRQVGLRFMKALGFDFRHGRLDVSLHPFTGGVPTDVRITTRYDEADFTSSLMGVLHETGHALYELGLPKFWRNQPVGEARGMVLHESQSLLIEMQVCRGPEFLTYAAPILRRAFRGEGSAWSAENLGRIYRRVQPGLIRVDADEVTYPAHVILRYRLEQAMLSGDLPVADLPHAWNDGMQTLLGVDVPDDARGCLQDIHWAVGSIGYFPTYTLGALAAAQLFAAAKERDPAILPGIARGNFRPLLRWLRQNVHGRGSLVSTDRILRDATGRPLGTAAFKAHLKARYLN
ncbi:MAG TPA: carboxypeptidase M32 [Ferrovibrio sp.]|jgi:carboxypeptidase Taq|uniref:carboxypeptidase M32 n=1 Tax=Ferrovibrio sp. TaxID=1917215 RepID=UPI002B4AE07A|nr:carboxypeptidase M32 [Ferrovibrio sp.]HLT78851.1 carboxypeptidase M32 [Ferrovibrio sp.]